MSDSCIFCRIIAGEIPSAKVAETSTAIAIRDVAPAAPVHVLVIPKVHITSLADATDSALLGELVTLAAAVARSEGIDSSGYRTVINTGADGGQSVSHLHLHVLGGRAMGWPPG
jgi:histidine triad (HIT) family protein